MWKDDEHNVVPACTCPANRNVNDCCAGIMCALQNQPEFKAWYGKSFLDKKEILSRRLRADLDPVSERFFMLSSLFTQLLPQFIDIAQLQHHMRANTGFPDASQSHTAKAPTEPVIVTGSQLLTDWAGLVAEIGNDQFLVSTDFITSYDGVHSYNFCDS